MEQKTKYISEDVVLEDNQLICALTKKIKRTNEKELTLQSMIMMLNEEYNFDLSDMERDFSFSYEDDYGKTKRAKADLAIFESGKAHDLNNMIRIAIVFDSKVKDQDSKKGVTETLGVYLESTDCEFGVWTNGNDLHYLQCEKDDFGQAQTSDISDFPGKGQSMQDLELAGERANPLKTLRFKTSVLASKLKAKNYHWKAAWIEGVVTLSNPRQNKFGLDRESACYRATYTLGDDLIDFITDSERVGKQENAIQSIAHDMVELTAQPEQLLTIQEAAEFLSLTVQTMYSKVSKGELPAMKRSKRLYFSRPELLEYLKQGRKKVKR